MALQIIGVEECTVLPRKGRRININAGTGQICISSEACELVGLEPGNSVIFFQDEDDAQEWYVAKTLSGNGFVTRAIHKDRFAATFCKKSLCRRIFASLDTEKKTGTVRLSDDAVEVDLEGETVIAFPLITAALKS